MKHFSMSPQAAVTGTCSSTTVGVVVKLPAGISAFQIGVETVNARVTLDGTTPTATNGLIYYAGVSPVLVPCSHDAVITYVATGAGTSVVQIQPLI